MQTLDGFWIGIIHSFIVFEFVIMVILIMSKKKPQVIMASPARELDATEIEDISIEKSEERAIALEVDSERAVN